MKNFWLGRHKQKEKAKKAEAISKVVNSVLQKKLGRKISLGLKPLGIKPFPRP